MKIEPPTAEEEKWINHRFYCECGSLITLERGDKLYRRPVKTWLGIHKVHWMVFCPVCNTWVRFDDRRLDYY